MKIKITIEAPNHTAHTVTIEPPGWMPAEVAINEIADWLNNDWLDERD